MWFSFFVSSDILCENLKSWRGVGGDDAGTRGDVGLAGWLADAYPDIIHTHKTHTHTHASHSTTHSRIVEVEEKSPYYIITITFTYTHTHRNDAERSSIYRAESSDIWKVRH